MVSQCAGILIVRDHGIEGHRDALGRSALSTPQHIRQALSARYPARGMSCRTTSEAARLHPHADSPSDAEAG